MGRKLNGRVRFMGDVCIWEREVYEIKRQIGGGIWERGWKREMSSRRMKIGEGGNGRGW